MTNEGLSAYELARLNRIKKNEAYLESIGLGSARQKMKEICKKTKKNVQRSQRVVVNPSQRRKSSRLSRNTMKDKHVQLSYYDDNEETVIEQDEEEAFVEYYDEAPARSRSKRYTTINRSDFELSSEEKQALGRSIDENYLYKFKEFLVFHNKISQPNARNVMRQVSKLARGDGIRYESPKYGWAENLYFMKGHRVTPMSDIVQLMEEAQECEDKWGRDRGNGWLLSHPLKKLLLFQQFCLNNPDFLTSKCKLSQYYAMADDCEMKCSDDIKGNIVSKNTEEAIKGDLKDEVVSENNEANIIQKNEKQAQPNPVQVNPDPSLDDFRNGQPVLVNCPKMTWTATFVKKVDGTKSQIRFWDNTHVQTVFTKSLQNLPKERPSRTYNLTKKPRIIAPNTTPT